MKNWLVGSWEPNWHSFFYFNLYRLIVALFLLLSIFLPLGWNMHAVDASSHLFLQWLVFFYALLAGGSIFLSRYWHHRFNLQLTGQVCLDVLMVSCVMYWLGGVSSGIGLLLMISLAAASLVGQGRMVLFYAAVATIAVLGMQSWGIWRQIFDASTIVQAGLLSGGFFATAILARLLGQRAMEHQDLARRRGIALANQNHIALRILERMQDGVLVVDRAGIVLNHNPGAVDMLQTPVLEGGKLHAFSPTLAAAFSVWQEGKGSSSIEFDNDGGGKLRARFEATQSSAGEALIFIEDVGRIRDQALQLKLASLGRLTASIAHEIRNPLAAISHASDLLHEERRGEMHDRLLRILHDNIFRLDRIVQDILSLGRSDRGQAESVALATFLQGFVDEFCSVEKMDPALIVLEMQPLSLRFDRSQLLQVVWNLVANAFRHASRSAGCVRLRVQPGKEERVELHVIDDGPGIPDACREQVFEPFFTTCHQGTGLGLFIARELCEANAAILQLLPDTSGHFVIIGGGGRESK